MAYCRVDFSDLVDLRERLKPELPRAGSLCTSVRNVIEGRVEGHFYTDGWPEFTTVVFQCLQPRLSDECDLHCYTTSKQRLPSLLEQAHLVTSGQWQYVEIVEDDANTVTDYLVQNLKLDGKAKLLPTIDYSVTEYRMYTLLEQLPTTNTECPEGYILGRLAVEHSTFLSFQGGQWVNSLGRPPSVVKEYYKQCIQRFPSAAAYCDSDPSTLVAWQMQHPTMVHWETSSLLKDIEGKGWLLLSSMKYVR